MAALQIALPISAHQVLTEGGEVDENRSANEGENEYVDSSAAMQRKGMKTESKNKGCERPNVL